MARLRRGHKNKLVVELKDKKGYSFSQIAKEMGWKAKSTVHEIYHAEKKRSGLTI